MRATAKRLLELCRSWRPDILHAHSPVLNAFPALHVGRKLGIPVVYEIRAFWEDAAVTHGDCREASMRYRISRWAETRALLGAQAVTVICEGLKREIVERGIPESKVSVISNAVDLDSFVPLPSKDENLVQRYGLEGAVVGGFIGSFYRYEGLDLLIRAVPAVIRRNPNFRLLLVGGGPEEVHLKQLTRELGLGSHVIFTGRVAHSDVPAHYSVVDLFVYPRIASRLTDLVTPLKPLESMAMEKIVVASDIGGHRQLLGSESPAFLVAPGNVDDLAGTILRVAAEREQWCRLGRLGRRYVEQNHIWPKTVAQYEPIYHRLAFPWECDGARGAKQPAYL
jgi:PEP-CTERM/exosortase A-associated glycosyltransferase